jgi:hypothetical protein
MHNKCGSVSAEFLKSGNEGGLRTRQWPAQISHGSLDGCASVQLALYQIQGLLDEGLV